MHADLALCMCVCVCLRAQYGQDEQDRDRPGLLCWSCYLFLPGLLARPARGIVDYVVDCAAGCFTGSRLLSFTGWSPAAILARPALCSPLPPAFSTLSAALRVPHSHNSFGGGTCSLVGRDVTATSSPRTNGRALSLSAPRVRKVCAPRKKPSIMRGRT